MIWQYWGQGGDLETLPDTVQRCFASIDKYKEDYTVIRLNDQSIADYIDFPEFIYQANGDYKFSKVFFSDLLRLALLHVYGGVWLDATILLTAPLDEKYNQQDYFVFQRCPNEPNKSFWAGPHTSYWSWNKRYRVKMLNSIIFAKRQSVVITTMLDLILYYWRTQPRVNNYFFFQILYNELMQGQLKDGQCRIVSDTLPHLLRVRLGDENYISVDSLLNQINIHKLTYFDEQTNAKLDQFIIDATSFREI